MSLRNWAIRGLILTGVAALAGLAWVAHSWVSPERVRAQLIQHLSEEFDDVEVHVGSAHMRLFGGIAVADIRLTRVGDAEPFLVIPSGVLYHDKEQLSRGRLVVRKVELDNPEVRLDRGPDGKWNVAGVMKPAPADKPVPTFVVKGGTLRVTDRGPDPLPPITLTDAHATLLNDPLPILAVQGKGNAQGFGELVVLAKLNRVSGEVKVKLEAPQFPLGDAAAAAGRLAPDVAPHLAGLAATASVTADLTYTPDAPRKWRHDVRIDVKDARFAHTDIPWPVEKIAATVRVVNGLVKVDDASATVNGAKMKVTFETRPEPAVPAPPAGAPTDEQRLRRLEDHFQKIEVTATGVALDDAVFKHLPEKARKTRESFSPAGQVDVGYKFVREGGGWRRELEVRPRQITAAYHRFKYPVSDLRGWVKRTDSQGAIPVVAVDLTGTAGGQVITIKGQVTGDGDDPGVNLRITGANVPLDDSLVKALPPRYGEMVRRFRASGRGDFVAEIVQQAGVNLCENEFRVTVRGATLNHAEFPFPLDEVKGVLVVRSTATDHARPVRPGDSTPPPDRDEIVLNGFTAVHAGAAVWLNGGKRPIPNSRDQKITLHIGANDCPVDADMKAALAAIGVEEIWTRFDPRGRITFAADLELIDRAAQPDRPDQMPKVNPATDLKVTFNFGGAPGRPGPTVTPKFFPYELTDTSGWLEYKNGRVDVAHLAGRHGPTRLKLAAGEVRFYPEGGVWANVGGLELSPLVADADLLKALPRGLATAVEEMKLKGGAELLVKHLVVLDGAESGRLPPEPPPVARGQAPQSPVSRPTPPSPPDPVVYWDAEVRLSGASFDTGVAWERVFGAVACRGRYEGTHVGLLRGAVWLDRATIARQPVERLSARVVAPAQVPDPARPGEFLPTELEFTDVNGDLFHGTLGGQARVVLTDPPRFNLWLTATDVQLHEVAKHYEIGKDADLKGVAQAQLLLYNRPDPKTGRLVVEGSGKIDVPTGRMYNLPVLLELIKLAKGNAPDGTAFEEAHATFRVHGDRIKVEQVDLIGKAVCLGGSGELDTTGEYVKFDFYTLGSQVLARLRETPVGDLSAFVSKNLFKIKLTRENGELKYKPEAVPLVTEPMKAVADRLRPRLEKMFGGGSK